MKDPVLPKELSPSLRTLGFSEVVSTYTEKEVQAEASRCLQCPNPTCIEGCPVNVDIKKFIGQIQKKDYKGAYLTIKEKNNFLSICGRVCPAEYQCRKSCILTKKGEPFASGNAININFLERFVGDYGMKNNIEPVFKKDDKLSKFKVAVVGSGPSGLCAAGELARAGVSVVIFEALHKPGGVLRYGIPPFRLPSNILDNEINHLEKMGVEIVCNFIVGKTETLNGIMKDGFSAVFLGVGAGVPALLGIKGENSCNVYSANEFLTRVNLMKAYEFPKFHTPINVGRHIVVIGGGNTAMDAARVALRIQRMRDIEPDVTVCYRRSEAQMPARRLEIRHAKEEGVKFNFLSQPNEFIADDNGFVKKVKLLKCYLGDADSSGRRRPVVIPGSDFTMDCDLAIVAIGLRANQVITRATPSLKTDKYGNIVVNPDTMETAIPGVFAGGDIVGGEGTVIEAMGMAKLAAKSIIEFLNKKHPAVSDQS